MVSDSNFPPCMWKEKHHKNLLNLHDSTSQLKRHFSNSLKTIHMCPYVHAHTTTVNQLFFPATNSRICSKFTTFQLSHFLGKTAFKILAPTPVLLFSRYIIALRRGIRVDLTVALPDKMNSISHSSSGFKPYYGQEKEKEKERKRERESSKRKFHEMISYI